MKDLITQESVSNERFYLAPHAFTTILFEKELRKNNIQFLKDDTFFLGPSIVFSFFEKDLICVTDIFDKIQQDEIKQIDLDKQKKKDRNKKKRQTLEYRPKQIAIWILILLGIIIILSVLL